MLRPFIIVGVGGSGGKTVRALKQSLAAQLESMGWEGGLPEAWQFLHIDSPSAQDGLEFPAPLLPQEEYLPLVPFGATYRTVHSTAVDGMGSDLKDLQRALPSPSEVSVPVAMGAGAFRAIGRAISAASLDKMTSRFKLMVSSALSPDAKAELNNLADLMQIKQKEEAALPPTTIVVSSMAGGSGAGMFIDVAEALKAAIGSANWNNGIVSMLYSPDVFGEFGEGVKKMIPNTLGALAEMTSGFYLNTHTAATQALYSKFGLIVTQGPRYSLGANYNFIIGRKNTSGVDFGSQTGMYMATGQAMSAWLTDPIVQDTLSAYTFTNMLNTSAMQPDNTGLRRVKLDAQPLFSLGFARVSLGLDKFSEYAAQRLAKQTLETGMHKHLENDPELREKKEEEWIEYHADINFGTFIHESGLNEKSESANQVVDALQPDLTELKARLVADVLSASSAGMAKGGNSFEQWVNRITTSYENSLGEYLDELEAETQAKVRDWVSMMPGHIMALVRKTIAQQGIKVTVELLSRLVDDAKTASRELGEEKGVHIGHSSMVTNEVSSALGPAATMSAIPSGHPTVSAAMSAVETSFYWRSVAEVKSIARDVLDDFISNFIEPMRSSLSKSLGALKIATEENALPDNRVNPYPYWPDFKTKSVSEDFEPAPNESILIDPKTFPKEFDELVEATVNDPNINSGRAVIAQILGGSENLDNLDEIKPTNEWRVFGYQGDNFWVPKNRHYQIKSEAPQPAKFFFETDHMKYLDFAKKWMRIPGRTFYAYLNQSIVSYINANGDPALKQKRGSDFSNAMKTVIRNADPLVTLNKALEQAVHGGEIGKSATCTGIPVDIDENDPLYPSIKDAIIASGYPLENSSMEKKWFIGASDGAKKTSVEVFSLLGTPVNPVVVESLMEPIASQWKSVSGEYSSRGPFMNWRRGRQLSEAIPASDRQWQKMLNGWFVARILDLFENDTGNADYERKGPIVRIWDGPGNGYVSFPHPLYSADSARNVDDYPAIVLDSLMIALSECYVEQSLKPLLPYQRLMQLGGGEHNHWGDLEDWILRGKSDAGGPTPRPERAGLATGSVSERRSSAYEYITQVGKAFDEKMSRVDPHADPKFYPIAWELRDETLNSIERVKQQIAELELSSDL